jgi:hypothetical protein
MAITDIQISEELETNAPSIKYKGDEGPKSPQEMEQMIVAQLEEEYAKYVFEMEEQGIQPMSLQQFIEQAMAEGQMSGGQPLPQDPTKPVNPFAPKPTGPVLPDRQMAAYGGMMGDDGRRRYGLGSFLKKTVRKIIPNEVADIAVKAAPFIAPFNPIAAGLAAGLGSFDKTGRMGSSIKSGLMNYGLGQVARGIGGGTGNLQTGFNPMGGFGDATTFGKGLLSNPMQGEGGLSKFLADRTSAPAVVDGSSLSTAGTGDAAIAEAIATGDLDAQAAITDKLLQVGQRTKTPKGILKTISDFALDNKLLTGLAAGTLGATALMGNMEADEIQDLQRGEGLDVEGIRAEVIEAFKDESGEKLKALRVKYPFLGRRDTKDIANMAMGGRIGKAEGGLMDLGGMEKDYRAEGGFVPIGREEKADDVPARLSVNEFVFTADAVRNAGGGDIDKGAEVMENMMKNLEAGGQVSEESQGMAGAQQMFETSERLSEVI